MQRSEESVKKVSEYQFREVITPHRCWFCDHDNVKINSRVMRSMALLNNTVSKHYAYCPKCHAKGPIKESETDAIHSWNNAGGQ